MKLFALLLPVLSLLLGCGSERLRETPLGYATTRLSGPQFDPRFVALQQAGAPILQIGFVRRQEGGSVLLEKRLDDFDYWMSPDGAHLILQDGLLHGTRGFGEGLMASELSQPIAHIKGLEPGYSDRFHTYLDGNDRAVTRTYRCLFTDGGQDEVAIPGKVVQTTILNENCRSLDQEFTNIYWVSPSTRRIIQSRQWAGPIIGAISTRVVE